MCQPGVSERSNGPTCLWLLRLSLRLGHTAWPHSATNTAFIQCVIGTKCNVTRNKCMRIHLFPEFCLCVTLRVRSFDVWHYDPFIQHEIVTSNTEQLFAFAVRPKTSFQQRVRTRSNNELWRQMWKIKQLK